MRLAVAMRAETFLLRCLAVPLRDLIEVDHVINQVQDSGFAEHASTSARTWCCGLHSLALPPLYACTLPLGPTSIIIAAATTLLSSSSPSCVASSAERIRSIMEHCAELGLSGLLQQLKVLVSTRPELARISSKASAIEVNAVSVVNALSL
jgi:hypothetical protein